MNRNFDNGFEQLAFEFEHPSAEFSPMPFWFWNDTLTEEEISRQMREFQRGGVDGFVIHARLGLDPAIEYMGEQWLHFVRYAVKLAAEMDMKVILYDEAMYPSGSCCGQVVKENPDFRAKGLRMSASPELAKGERLIGEAVVDGVSRYFILTYTGGTIRGVYFGQDDGEPAAPPAADLLNPEAVATFIRLTHDKYYGALSEYFGNTVIAIFTDEPSLLGRCARRDVLPWTDDFLDDFLAKGYTVSHLAALFDADFDGHRAVFDAYEQALLERMSRCYYTQIAEWCHTHGIELTGHPAESDDIHLLSHFGIPCQDIVWRYIAPGEESSLNGAHSTMGKCASDSARHRLKRRNGNECFGACGHADDPYAFDRSDMKWYIDWLFVRGCNLIIPHAFYYSLRGARRDERPPEVGIFSPLWSNYREISDYIKRCSAINTDSVNLTDVAVLCSTRHLSDLVARPLYEEQIEFNYIEKELLDGAILDGGALKVAEQVYRVIITESEADAEHPTLRAFALAGGRLIDYSSYAGERESYLKEIRKYSRTLTNLDTHRDLRLTRVRKYGVDILFLTNEGEETVTTTVREPVLEIWDSEKGTRTAHNCEMLSLTLERRKSVHLIMKRD